MRIFVLIAALAFPAMVAAQQPDWRFAHSDATLVGTLRPQELLNSPLLAAAMADATKDQNTAAMLAMARGFLGGITEVRFSLQDNGTPEPDVVALISGKLDDALLGMMAQDKASVRRIDANTVLIGKGLSLEKAAARMTETTAKLQPRALAGTEALSVYDFWISGKLPDLPQTAMLKMDLRGLALGLSMRDGIEAELAMEAASAAQAEALIKAAHQAESQQPVQYRGMFQSFADGATARFHMKASKEVLLDAIRTRGSGVLPGPLASASPAPLPEAPKPRRNSIVIEGLDGGTREIPLK